MPLTRSLIRQLANAEGEEREALRRNVRQQLRGIVSEIVAEKVDGKTRRSDKRCAFTVQFTNGEQRGIWYETDRSGAVVKQGLWSHSYAELEKYIETVGVVVDREQHDSEVVVKMTKPERGGVPGTFEVPIER